MHVDKCPDGCSDYQPHQPLQPSLKGLPSHLLTSGGGREEEVAFALKSWLVFIYILELPMAWMYFLFMQLVGPLGFLSCSLLHRVWIPFLQFICHFLFLSYYYFTLISYALKKECWLKPFPLATHPRLSHRCRLTWNERRVAESRRLD